MNVTFVTYPVEEWILNEATGILSEPEYRLEAISQDIKFALSTERNKYPIMGSNFGIELIDLVGKDMQYVKAQIKKRVRDALSIDDRIKSIDNFVFTSQSRDELNVSFTVETIMGYSKFNTTVSI